MWIHDLKVGRLSRRVPPAAECGLSNAGSGVMPSLPLSFQRKTNHIPFLPPILTGLG